MKDFKVFVFQNEIIQIIKDNKAKNKDYWSNDFYNIYMNGKPYIRCTFNFYIELEFNRILNAKSIVFNKIRGEDFKRINLSKIKSKKFKNEISKQGKIKMIKIFYDRDSQAGYITFRPIKIENRVVQGRYYIERDFKKKFPILDSYHLNINEHGYKNFGFKNLDLKQLKVETI